VRTLKNTNNDFTLSSGRLEWVEGIDALAQILENRISLGLSEWFLAPEEGVDWIGLLNQKVFFEERAIQQIKTAIRKEPAVLNIDFITAAYDRKQRLITISFQIKTTFGLLNTVQEVVL
jgi:hypothetical protein